LSFYFFHNHNEDEIKEDEMNSVGRI